MKFSIGRFESPAANFVVTTPWFALALALGEVGDRLWKSGEADCRQTFLFAAYATREHGRLMGYGLTLGPLQLMWMPLP